MKEIHNTMFWPVFIGALTRLAAKFFVLLSLLALLAASVSLILRIVELFVSIGIPIDDLSNVFIFGLVAWVLCILLALALDADSVEILPF